MLTLTTGTAFMMWVGEQITERGIGNGISLIIFAGIVDGIPDGDRRLLRDEQGQHPAARTSRPSSAIVLATVAAIVFFERAQRQIPIYYAQANRRPAIYGGQTAHLPLRVNTAGIIPPIFASSLLMFPAHARELQDPRDAAAPVAAPARRLAFNTFYVAAHHLLLLLLHGGHVQPVDVADNLKKQRRFIPSIRQGKQTADYIDYVLTRITFGGALYVAVVCVVPSIISQKFHVPFRWGGTSIMIVVGVALDTVQPDRGAPHHAQLRGALGRRRAGPRASACRKD